MKKRIIKHLTSNNKKKYTHIYDSEKIFLIKTIKVAKKGKRVRKISTTEYAMQLGFYFAQLKSLIFCEIKK
jgi:hypothetical protein